MAVAVVTEQGQGGAIAGSNVLRDFINFLSNSWPYLLIAIVLIILAIIIFYLINKLEDERKERDEPGYQVYKSVKMACELNKDERLIRKTFNPATLFFILFPPFLWLMFVLKKEHSAKVLDYQNNLLGYYRGDYVGMDNTWNLLVYKSKWLIFFEKTFVIKIPLSFQVKRKVKDKKGRIMLEKDNKTPIIKEEYVDLKKFIQRLPNGDIKLQATSVEPVGLYYKCPVFIIPQTGGVVDYRSLLEGAIVDNTYQVMASRLLNLGARQMEKGMLFNPDLQYKRLAPEKTKEEEKLDKYE